MPTRSARRVAALALLSAVLGASRAAAQTPDQPNLIFTISGGMLVGPQLWTLPQQLVLDQTFLGNSWDSVALGRTLRPGFAATLGATFFRSPRFGYSLEAGFFGIDTESQCRLRGPASTTNAAACAYLQGQIVRGDAVGLLAGFMWRLKPGGTQPYVRVGVGPAILGASYVEEAAPVLLTNGSWTTVYMLADQHHRELTWMASLGVGAMLPLGPGYQLHLELRDLIVALPRPIGAAVDTAEIAADQVLPQPPIGMRVTQVPTFTIGLDVVLERRRGHRY